MRAIYKYALGFQHNEIEMPADPKFIHFGVQEGALFVWALVDTSREKKMHRLFIIGTGDGLEDDWQFVSTTTDDKPYVWHLFYGGVKG